MKTMLTGAIRIFVAALIVWGVVGCGQPLIS
jgi:hypothetical protein